VDFYFVSASIALNTALDGRGLVKGALLLPDREKESLTEFLSEVAPLRQREWKDALGVAMRRYGLRDRGLAAEHK
jgi:hypothetical protein